MMARRTINDGRLIDRSVQSAVIALRQEEAELSDRVSAANAFLDDAAAIASRSTQRRWLYDALSASVGRIVGPSLSAASPTEQAALMRLCESVVWLQAAMPAATKLSQYDFDTDRQRMRTRSDTLRGLYALHEGLREVRQALSPVPRAFPRIPDCGDSIDIARLATERALTAVHTGTPYDASGLLASIAPAVSCAQRIIQIQDDASVLDDMLNQLPAHWISAQ